jgi:phosphonate transport system ATP-binding protein
MHALEIASISKKFPGQQTAALNAVSLRVGMGEIVALIGASGSGKSTLLRHIAGNVAASSGKISALGRVVQAEGKISRDIRQQRANIGFVFQQFNLVGRSTLLTNVLAGHLGRMPTWRAIAHMFTPEEKEAAYAALHEVGLLQFAHQRASTLSGGQQQRAAIARCLVQRAALVLADEPIASLDPESSRKVMELLAALSADRGLTVIVSLHQVDMALKYCPRVVALKTGEVVYDGSGQALSRDLLHDVYRSDADGLSNLLSGQNTAPDNTPNTLPLTVLNPATAASASHNL